MRILSMTATFGKLNHETLTLEPGLNILEAPNEWGKSTWCAFLTAMFYGIDTRAKSTRTQLSEKEHYAPWSGAPMEGRMELEWEGKIITIERQSRGRIPMGHFRAYETHTGVTIPQLTAANCGQVLLGMERSVFLRSAFIRFSDLPVTQDESLRRRLNALVTTGDESGNGEHLARGLRELKNRCRYHSSGLLPQAEGEARTLEASLAEQEALTNQCVQLEAELSALKNQLQALENHRDALEYAEALSDAQRVTQVRQLCSQLEARLLQADTRCQALPSVQILQKQLQALQQLSDRFPQLQSKEPTSIPPLPEPLPAFAGKTGDDAVLEAANDASRFHSLTKRRALLSLAGIFLLLSGAALSFIRLVPGLLAAALGFTLCLIALLQARSRKRKARALAKRYQEAPVHSWISLAEDYAAALQQREAALLQEKKQQEALTRRQNELEQALRQLTGGQNPEKLRVEWEAALAAHRAAESLRRELQLEQAHLDTLTAMARTAPPPRFPDALTLSDAETRQQIARLSSRRQQLQDRLSQNRGRIAGIGDSDTLRRQLTSIRERIRKLETCYAALSVAQEILAEATAELQRRFAPRITRKAADYLNRLTEGHYDRLRLDEDLALYTGSHGEETLRTAQWRSDGTADQMYLALRLAVSGELAPEVPLILDDALVRFDDRRLRQALLLLREEAQNRQILLFTCQNRENLLLKGQIDSVDPALAQS